MKNKSVGRVILNTIKEKWLLTAGIVITVVGAIVMALFPPLILAKIIDTITSDTMPAFCKICVGQRACAFAAKIPLQSITLSPSPIHFILFLFIFDTLLCKETGLLLLIKRASTEGIVFSI